MYKTLPSALRRDDRAKHGATSPNNHAISHGGGGVPHPLDPADPHSSNGSNNSEHGGPLFSLNLNLGLSNLISGGMNFIGQLRKNHHKSHSSASTPVSFSSLSAGSSTVDSSSPRSSMSLTTFSLPCIVAWIHVRMHGTV